PPEFPSFHLIRAYHSTDRCVDCHECERACPARIPLVTLYRMIRKDVEDMFGYKIGTNVDEKPPLVTVLEEEG
ncbi:MAG: 4Fe-4S binding protein, partial [Candidatus Thorarchaeota archaeon]